MYIIYAHFIDKNIGTLYIYIYLGVGSHMECIKLILQYDQSTDYFCSLVKMKNEITVFNEC